MIPYLMTGIYSNKDIAPVTQALWGLKVNKVFIEVRPDDIYFDVVEHLNRFKQPVVPMITMHGRLDEGIWDYIYGRVVTNYDSLYSFERFNKIYELMNGVCRDFETPTLGLVMEPDPIQLGFKIDFRRLAQLFTVLNGRRRSWWFDQPTYVKPGDESYIAVVDRTLSQQAWGKPNFQRPHFMPLEPLRTGQFDPTSPEFLFWKNNYSNRAYFRMAVSVKGNPEYPWTPENVAKVLAYWRNGISRTNPVLYVATPEITEVCNELRRIL